MYTTSHYHHHNHDCDDQCLRTQLVIIMVMIVIITLCITVIRDISYIRLGTKWICTCRTTTTITKHCANKLVPHTATVPTLAWSF